MYVRNAIKCHNNVITYRRTTSDKHGNNNIVVHLNYNEKEKKKNTCGACSALFQHF